MSKVWIPLRATNFHSLMYPSFFIGMILGRITVKFQSSSYVLSKPRFIYSTIVTLGYVCLLLTFFYQINFSGQFSGNIVSVLNINFFLLLDGCIVVVISCIHRNGLYLIQNFLKTSEILSPEDFDRMAKIIHTKDILGSLFLTAQVYQFSTNLKFLIQYCLILYIIFVNFLIDMCYMNYVCVINACFRKINESLLKLNKTLNQNECPSILAEKVSQEGQKNPLVLIRLKHLEQKHLQVSDSIQLLNKTFLLRIIAVAISTFVLVTFNLYFYLLWLHSSFLDSSLDQFWLVPYIMSAAYHFCKFALMIWACEAATNQSLKIGTTLHDLLCNATDATVRRELRMFSLQVLHCDNSFTAKVFTMNTSLLTQILGGITMYIMILFQFLLSSLACQFPKEEA